MAAPRGSSVQARFWLGELRPEVTARTEPEITRQGLRRAENSRPTQSGQLVRRPGSVFINDIGEQFTLVNYTDAAGTDLVLAFSNATMQSFRLSDGAKVGEVTGAPWTTAMLANLSFDADADKLYVAHRDLQTQVLQFTSGSWTRSAFAFDSGAGSSKLQPYYRFDDLDGITLTPGAYTGTGISLQTSADFFTSDHVGVRIRYAFREIDIKTVSDAQNATGDVVDELPPAYDVTVTDASGFRVNDVVVGADSGAQGRVLAVNTGTNVIQVLIINGFEGFDGGAPGEDIDGPSHSSNVSGTPSKVGTPPATLLWDEQFMSAARGWPGWVSIFRSRLVFCDFGQEEGALFLSRAGVLTDGDVEDGDTDSAILEVLKDQQRSRIIYAVPSQNLILLTPNKTFYVSDDPQTGIITPATISFKTIARIGAKQIRPVQFETSVIFVDAGGNRVMEAFPTGEFSRPWAVGDLSADHSHLIKTPVGLTATEGSDQDPERYVYAVNSDGTIACMFTRDLQERGRIIGWFPWSTQGSWKEVTAIDGVVYCAVTRTVGGSTQWYLERFENDRLIDSAAFTVDATAFVEIVTSAGDKLVDSQGNQIVTSSQALLHLAGETVAVIADNRDYGDFTVSADGTIDDPVLDGVTFDAGFNFTVTVDPFWPDNPDRRNVGTRRTLGGRIVVNVYQTVGLKVFNRVLPRQDWKNIDTDPSPRTTSIQARKQGHKFLHEYDNVIVQDRPGALTIRSVQIQN